MKNLILYAGLSLVFFSSCKTSQVSSFSDDIYTNPAEEQQKARVAAQQRAQQEADARAKEEAARVAQKAKDDANPAYQDPKADPDDYYDYKYASRLNRFSDPVPGAGYYDSRYTNYYTYNQNPSMYGSSIYSSYNWMPSSQFNSYSSGLSIGVGTGYGMGMGSMMYGSPYGAYSPYSYGYNNFGYSPYGYGMGMGYSPYGYNSFGSMYYDPFYGYNSMSYYSGYNAGLYSGYNSGWGYYNSFDANSGYSNAPRGSNGGENSPRGTTAGMAVANGENARTAYIRSVAQQQQNTPRFTETARTTRAMQQGYDNSGNGQNALSPNGGRNAGYGNYQNNNNGNGNANSSPRNTNGNPSRVAHEQEVNTNPTNTNSNRTGNFGGGGFQGGGSSGGFSSPRGGGGGGGGGNRPR